MKNTSIKVSEATPNAEMNANTSDRSPQTEADTSSAARRRIGI